MSMSEPKGFGQFIKYALLGLIASVAELAVYFALDFWVFSALKDVDFSWWILDYSVAKGGLGTFYAVIISFAVGQVVNFIVQRKSTFKANNNPVFSAVMYSIMVIAVWVLQIFIVGVIIGWLAPIIGMDWGTILAKAISMTLSLLITFPLNKFVIMRRSKTAQK